MMLPILLCTSVQWVFGVQSTDCSVRTETTMAQSPSESPGEPFISSQDRH